MSYSSIQGARACVRSLSLALFGAICVIAPVPAKAAPVCPNSKTESPETCDDGNIINGDGCSSACAKEAGWTCTAPATAVSVCQKCGNSKTSGTETCDDGNTTSLDGCSNVCAIESGFSCTASATAISVCHKCGDSKTTATETCDDGNTTSLDGCSSTCAIEPGYSCTVSSSAVSVCQKCGDGVKSGTEVCDDGNTTSYDGCNGTCSAVGLCFTCTTPGQRCTRTLSTGTDRPAIITPGVAVSDYSVKYDAEEVCQPYMYSDFTGQQLRLASTLRGFYYQIFEGCTDGKPTTWGDLKWDAVLPSSKTRIAFRGRVADTILALSARPWTPIALTAPDTSPTNIANALRANFVTAGEGLTGRYLQVEVMLESDTSASVFVTPELKSMSVTSTCSTPARTSGTVVSSYSAADYCVSPEVPEWYALTYKVSTPGDSSVNFEVRAADTQAGLDTAKPAIVSVPGAANNPDEGQFDTGKLLRDNGLSSSQKYLRVTAVLKPSSDGTLSPVFYGYDQKWLCVFAE